MGRFEFDKVLPEIPSSRVRFAADDMAVVDDDIEAALDRRVYLCRRLPPPPPPPLPTPPTLALLD